MITFTWWELLLIWLFLLWPLYAACAVVSGVVWLRTRHRRGGGAAVASRVALASTLAAVVAGPPSVYGAFFGPGGAYYDVFHHRTLAVAERI